MYEFLTRDDKKTIEEISNTLFEDLIQEIERSNQSSIFNTERLILQSPLNKLGLQPLRCLLSYRMNEARQNIRIHKYDEKLLRDFQKNGCLILDDIFSEKDVVGKTLRINDRFRSIAQMTLGDDFVPEYDMLTVQDMPAFREKDPQCDSHFDTFHPTCKIWVYMDDVTIDHAPLHYSQGTHKYDKTKLSFMYDLSCKLTAIKEGDFRDFTRQFNEPIPILGHRFTTIFVDVTGFHKRGNGKRGLIRKSARGNLNRKNPFRNINE